MAETIFMNSKADNNGNIRETSEIPVKNKKSIKKKQKHLKCDFLTSCKSV
jgi:hypothetical protein